MDDAAKIIINRARKQAKELDYSFEEALGDVLGGFLYEVDAALYPKERLPTDGKFKEYFLNHVERWFEKTTSANLSTVDVEKDFYSW